MSVAVPIVAVVATIAVIGALGFGMVRLSRRKLRSLMAPHHPISNTPTLKPGEVKKPGVLYVVSRCEVLGPTINSQKVWTPDLFHDRRICPIFVLGAIPMRAHFLVSSAVRLSSQYRFVGRGCLPSCSYSEAGNLASNVGNSVCRRPRI